MERMDELVVSETQEEVNIDDFITSEILSRLPVKSLLRFKCVRKRWQSIISKDQFFIDLHLSRSITARRTSFVLIGKPISYRSDGMYLLSAELLLPSNEEDGCLQVGTTSQWEPPFPKEYPAVCMLKGLICFMDTWRSRTCVYNSCTRESTQWIKSNIKRYEEKNGIYIRSKLLKHQFGYDPATKEYKVLAIWNVCEDGTYSVLCEVLTVRQNSWRRIYGIQSCISSIPVSLSCYQVSSVYMNGVIFINFFSHKYGKQTIVEFNVGSEKFRILERSLFRDVPCSILMELNGRLSVLTCTYTAIKLLILYNYDENVQDEKSKTNTSSSTTVMSTSNSGAGSSNHHWVEETIMLPDNTELDSVRHIPGTEFFIIRSTDDTFSFYHYKENRSYSISKINSEISASFRDEKGKLLYCMEFDIFTPKFSLVN